MLKVFFIVLLALSISAFGYSLTYADAVDADVIVGEKCIVVNEDVSGVSVPLITFETYKVNMNKNTVKAVCHFNIPEGKGPATAKTNKNFNCRITENGTIFPADDAHVVTTPGGQAVLTCKYKNNS